MSVFNCSTLASYSGDRDLSDKLERIGHHLSYFLRPFAGKMIKIQHGVFKEHAKWD